MRPAQVAIDAASRYRAIVADLAPDALAELWNAALFRRPVSAGLGRHLAELEALRTEVGLASAARMRARP